MKSTESLRLGPVPRAAGYAVRIFAGLSVLFLPQIFLRMDRMQTAVARLLHVTVDPVYSGGDVWATFIDRPSDDDGEGGLTYPLHPSFEEAGLLDLLRYTVHAPVTDARLDDPDDFWQIDVTLAKMKNTANAPYGFSQPVLHIYLDIDGRAGGSTETADPRCELVRFPSEHPWDFLIHVDGLSGGTIVSADRAYKREAKVIVLENRNAVHIRLPFDHPGLKAVLDGRPTYHYVLVGGSDPLAIGGFMKVDKEAGLRHGGGARSSLTPRVYDYLEPKGRDQKKILSSYRESSADLALLEPIEVKRESAGADRNRNALLARFKEEAQREMKERRLTNWEEEIRRLEQAQAGPIELMQANFAAGRAEETERLARGLLEKDQGDPIALAHLASLTAMKARNAASLSQAGDFVRQSLDLLQKAAANCHGDDQRLTVLLLRGNVEMAVPDSVFHTSAAAAGHLLEAADILGRQSPAKEHLIADCLLKAALAYEAAGDNENADSCWIRLSAFPGLKAAVKGELLERGYLPGER